MGLASGGNLNTLEMLGRCNFDNNYKWNEHTIPQNLHDTVEHFISTNKMSHQDA